MDNHGKSSFLIGKCPRFLWPFSVANCYLNYQLLHAEWGNSAEPAVHLPWQEPRRKSRRGAGVESLEAMSSTAQMDHMMTTYQIF